MPGLFNRFIDLIYPPRCASCDKLIPLYSESRVLCEECADYWECEKMIRIREAKALKGMPIQIITVAPYDTRKNGVGIGKAIVLELKSHPVRYAADFVASEIYSSLSWLYLPRDTVITWVPRSHKGMRENGFDQVELVAKRLSRMSGMKARRFLIHIGDTVQKELHGKDRIKNANKSYRIFEKCRGEICGSNILLVDDVATTGATLDACAKLLLSAGANRVFCVSFAGRIDDR